jgi:hypothetical protein
MAEMKAVNFRDSPREIQHWRDEAWAQRLTLSAWIRNRLNGVEMTPPSKGATGRLGGRIVQTGLIRGRIQRLSPTYLGGTRQA